MQPLPGKVAAVTGASRNGGRGIAFKFHSNLNAFSTNKTALTSWSIMLGVAMKWQTDYDG
jgi:hypothetical protein